jgi:hypothetical protein
VNREVIHVDLLDRKSQQLWWTAPQTVALEVPWGHYNITLVIGRKSHPNGVGTEDAL